MSFLPNSTAPIDPAPSSISQDDKKGRMEGVSVLGALLALTLGVAIFLFLRWRSKSSSSLWHDTHPSSGVRKQYDRLLPASSKLHTGRRSSELEKMVSALEIQLQQKNLKSEEAKLPNYPMAVEQAV